MLLWKLWTCIFMGYNPFSKHLFCKL
jgi:hypothetical protein